MPSVVDICNRGLQKLGADRITSITEDSVNARECNTLYESVKNAELRSHCWNFAIKRANLAQELSTPVHGYLYQYQLPSDFLRLLPLDRFDPMAEADYKIEGKMILSNEGSILAIRYIAIIDDPNTFDALFVEALASKLAVELCEKITQSNSKGQQAREDYKQAMREARKTNAYEKIQEEPTSEKWLTARS